jgi:hypothetical protein
VPEFTVRPSPKITRWYLAQVAVGVTLITIGVLTYLYGVSVLGAFGVLNGLVGLIARRGWVTVSLDRITQRRLGTATVRWADVSAIEVVRAGPFREITVRHHGRRRLGLVAPRSVPFGIDADFDAHAERLRLALQGWRAKETRLGSHQSRFWAVVVAAVVPPLVVLAAYDQPWKRDWWPGVRSVSATPDPCRVDATPTVGATAPAPARPVATGWREERGCRWKTKQNDLSVTYVRFRWTGNESGVDRAKADLGYDDVGPGGQAPEPLAGLGDEAYDYSYPLSTKRGWARSQVHVRMANVVLRVSYTGKGTVAQVKGAARRTATDAAGRIQVD